MNLKHCIVPALALALTVPTAAAQTTGQPEQRPQTEQQRPERDRDQDRRPDQQRAERADHNIIRADRLIGQAVRDQRGERLGRINDLAFDTKENRIAYAIVTRGGMWGIGGDDVMVQWNQIQPDPQQQAVRINEQQLEQAKRIDRGQAWPAGIGEGPVGTAGAAPQHRVLPMSNVVGMDVHNKQGERLGNIDDVVIQKDGKLSYAVIAHGGFLGVGDNYVAVPWDRLQMDAQRQALVLDTTRDQLQQARRFERGDRWPDRVDWPFRGGDDRR